MFAGSPPGTRPGARTVRAHGGIPSTPTRDGEIPATSVVTPWYAFQVTMTPSPPVAAFATRRARSLASEPVQVNMTWPRPVPANVASSCSAYSIVASDRYRVWVLSRAACSAIAATTRG
jgi:hypothetical protein